MLPHHTQSIAHLVRAFQADPEVHALILGGSLAHGFAKPDSDIDVAIVIPSEAYARRKAEGKLHYNNRTLCTYGGYIDGKYMDVDFLRVVAERGSDPIRYAFHGNRVLFSRVEALETLLAEITRYPVAEKPERIERFVAQLLAWRWYYSEAFRQDNQYLRTLAVQKLILFAARIVLAENELFFPYHKWMLRVLSTAPRQPAGLSDDIESLLGFPPWDRVDAFAKKILAFVGIDFATADAIWPTQFMKDTELRWMTQEACIDDI